MAQQTSRDTIVASHRVRPHRGQYSNTDNGQADNFLVLAHGDVSRRSGSRPRGRGRANASQNVPQRDSFTDYHHRRSMDNLYRHADSYRRLQERDSSVDRLNKHVTRDRSRVERSNRGVSVENTEEDLPRQIQAGKWDHVPVKGHRRNMSEGSSFYLAYRDVSMESMDRMSSSTDQSSSTTGGSTVRKEAAPNRPRQEECYAVMPLQYNALTKNNVKKVENAVVKRRPSENGTRHPTSPVQNANMQQAENGQMMNRFQTVPAENETKVRQMPADFISASEQINIETPSVDSFKSRQEAPPNQFTPKQIRQKNKTTDENGATHRPMHGEPKTQLLLNQPPDLAKDENIEDKKQNDSAGATTSVVASSIGIFNKIANIGENIHFNFFSPSKKEVEEQPMPFKEPTHSVQIKHCYNRKYMDSDSDSDGEAMFAAGKTGPGPLPMQLSSSTDSGTSSASPCTVPVSEAGSLGNIPRSSSSEYDSGTSSRTSVSIPEEVLPAGDKKMDVLQENITQDFQSESSINDDAEKNKSKAVEKAEDSVPTGDIINEEAEQRLYPRDSHKQNETMLIRSDEVDFTQLQMTIDDKQIEGFGSKEKKQELNLRLSSVEEIKDGQSGQKQTQSDSPKKAASNLKSSTWSKIAGRLFTKNQPKTQNLHNLVKLATRNRRTIISNKEIANEEREIKPDTEDNSKETLDKTMNEDPKISLKRTSPPDVENAKEFSTKEVAEKQKEKQVPDVLENVKKENVSECVSAQKSLLNDDTAESHDKKPPMQTAASMPSLVIEQTNHHLADTITSCFDDLPVKPTSPLNKSTSALLEAPSQHHLQKQARRQSSPVISTGAKRWAMLRKRRLGQDGGKQPLTTIMDFRETETIKWPSYQDLRRIMMTKEKDSNESSAEQSEDSDSEMKLPSQRQPASRNTESKSFAEITFDDIIQGRPRSSSYGQSQYEKSSSQYLKSATSGESVLNCASRVEKYVVKREIVSASSPVVPVATVTMSKGKQDFQKISGKSTLISKGSQNVVPQQAEEGSVGSQRSLFKIAMDSPKLFRGIIQDSTKDTSLSSSPDNDAKYVRVRCTSKRWKSDDSDTTDSEASTDHIISMPKSVVEATKVPKKSRDYTDIWAAKEGSADSTNIKESIPQKELPFSVQQTESSAVRETAILSSSNSDASVKTIEARTANDAKSFTSATTLPPEQDLDSIYRRRITFATVHNDDIYDDDVNLGSQESGPCEPTCRHVHSIVGLSDTDTQTSSSAFPYHQPERLQSTTDDKSNLVTGSLDVSPRSCYAAAESETGREREVVEDLTHVVFKKVLLQKRTLKSFAHLAGTFQTDFAAQCLIKKIIMFFINIAVPARMITRFYIF